MTTPNESPRHMVTFSRGLHDFAVAWAKAEGRTLGSLLTYVIEHGFRDLIENRGYSIPPAALQAYDDACLRRLLPPLDPETLSSPDRHA
jgi:hypothetical protein